MIPFLSCLVAVKDNGSSPAAVIGIVISPTLYLSAHPGGLPLCSLQHVIFWLIVALSGVSPVSQRLEGQWHMSLEGRCKLSENSTFNTDAIMIREI